MSSDENARATNYIEMWKQTVTVQQHFNDIEWRIRGLALTALTFSLGAAAVAAKDGTTFGGVSLGTIVLVIGLLLWYAFYFVDRYWYHPLLKASVRQGEHLEDHIEALLPGGGLTKAISAGSPVQRPRVIWLLGLGCADRNSSMHSEEKLIWFYRLGAIALVSAALMLQIGSWFYKADDSDPTPVIVTYEPTDMPTPSTTSGPTLTQMPSPSSTQQPKHSPTR